MWVSKTITHSSVCPISVQGVSLLPSGAILQAQDAAILGIVKKGERMNKHRKTAIIVGVLILVAFSVLGSGNPEAKTLGMVLEVISGLAVITIAVLMFPLFKPYNKIASYLYIALRGIEGGLLVVTGILFLSYNASLLEIHAGIHAVHGYIFGIAALVFYYLLYQSKLIPRWISVWGLIAAILLIIANLLETTGITSGLMILYLPIILNEVLLAIWLIVKGFDPTAIASLNAKTEKNAHANGGF
jgi:hypothetical protein